MARGWLFNKPEEPEPEPEKPKGLWESLFGKKETPPDADKSGGVGLSEGTAADKHGNPKARATHQAYSVNDRGVHHSHVNCWCNSKNDHPK
jgi:hypothetical protein